MRIEELRAAHQVGLPILSALILFPIAVALVLRFTEDARRAYRIGLIGAALEVVLAVLLCSSFESGVADLQLTERVDVSAGFSYHVGVDGISVLFIPLCALLLLLVALYARHVGKAAPGRYLAAIFALCAALIGAIASLDLLLFSIFSALELVPGAILIRRWGTGEKRALAAQRYLIFNGMGVALMAVGLVVLGLHIGAAAAPAGGGARFDLVALLRTPLPPADQTLVFFLFFLGLSVRVPLFPFHGWLTVVMEEGPVVGVSVFLVGIKLGAYGLLRFVIPVLPDAAAEASRLVAIVGLIGMVYGALLALVQTNLRRLLAFACLSHMGGVMVGLFSLNTAGLAGGLLSMFNVGIATMGLLFVAGFLHNRLGTADLGSISGLSQRLPRIALLFLIVAVAIIGMPGTTGFDAAHLVVEGALDAHSSPYAILAGVGSLLEAAYLFRYYQRAFLSSPRAALPDALSDLRSRELFIAGSVAALIIGLGIFSRPVLHAVTRSLEVVSERVEQRATREPAITTRRVPQSRAARHDGAARGDPYDAK